MAGKYGEDITEGRRVELSPGYDLWMQGAKYGRVERLEGTTAVVRMDHPDVRTLQRIPIGDLKGVGV